MKHDPLPVIVNGSLDDMETIARFQVDMAMESEGTRLDLERVRKGVTAVMEDPTKGRYFVAKVNDKPIGSLMITQEWSDWNNGWYWWIQSVYIKPEHRKQGVFKALYSKVKEEAKKTDVSEIRLYVDKHNTPAKNVYAQVGMNPSHYLIYEERL